MGIGALHFGVYCDQKQTNAIVHMALDRGVNFIDTAPMYGRGESEAFLRRSIEGRRDKVILATIVGLRPDIGEDGYFRCAKAPLVEEEIRKSLEASLRNLGTDCIDILQLHSFDHNTPIDETLAVLDSLIKEGKIRYAGCSNLDEAELDAAAASWNRHGFERFASFQAHYNLIERRSEIGLVPRCEENDIGIIVNRALARGILSGKYRAGEVPPAGSRGQLSRRVGNLLTEPVLRMVEDVRKTSEAFGRTPSAMSIAWLLSNPRVRCILVGARAPSQLEANLEAVEREITVEEIDALDRAIGATTIRDNVMAMPETFLEQ